MEILILAMIAAAVLFKLYNVLGNKKYGSGQASYPAGKPIALQAKVQAPKRVESVVKVYNKEEETLFETTYGKEIWEQIKKIQKLEAGFEPEAFIAGAKNAFEGILKAYDKTDIVELKKLVSKTILEHLQKDFEKREKQGQRYETTLIAIPTAEIKKITIDKKIAQVVIKFITDQVHLVKDTTGKIINGSPSQVDQMIDIWTFERTLGSSEAGWHLVAMSSVE